MVLATLLVEDNPKLRAALKRGLELTGQVRVVGGLDEAIDHIDRHSTGHSEAILTSDPAAADRRATCSTSGKRQYGANNRKAFHETRDAASPAHATP